MLALRGERIAQQAPRLWVIDLRQNHSRQSLSFAAATQFEFRCRQIEPGAEVVRRGLRRCCVGIKRTLGVTTQLARTAQSIEHARMLRRDRKCRFECLHCGRDVATCRRRAAEIAQYLDRTRGQFACL